MKLSLATLLMLAGAILAAAGLLCWGAGWDLPLHRLFRLSDPARVGAIVHLSSLGGLTVMGPLGIVGIIVLVVRGRADDALWLLAAVASGRLMVEGLKLIVTRPRPPVIDRLELVQSWSFPSSHSAGTIMTCVALALVFAGGRRSFPPALILALAAAAVIGWTRVALAVHWPSDVLAGWGVGLLWLGAALRIRPPAALAAISYDPPHRRPDPC